METIQEWLQRIDEKLDRLVTSQQQNADRRRQYRLDTEERQRGKVPLPSHHLLKFRDARLRDKIPGWAEAGMRFGAADKPEDFLLWFVYQWNNTCYLKKPITYSGTSFRVWTGMLRSPWAPSDLLGYPLRKKVQILRNDAELDDFQRRPWWEWAYYVFMPVFELMEDMPGFDKLPVRFVRCMKLILGPYSEFELYRNVYWDPNETIQKVNRMLKRVGQDFNCMLKACWTGLRARGPCPVHCP